MREDIREANVIIAKCRHSKMPFGIRIERRPDAVWYCNWAFPITERGASNEGYGDTMISGQMALDEDYPGCPYCRADAWFSCGKCGKLTCYGGEERVTCAWCSSSGGLRAADHFDLRGSGY